jgi:hypothetical protein
MMLVWMRFEQIRCGDLLRLGPEDRRQAYEALWLRVEVGRDGDARVFGVFDRT